MSGASDILIANIKEKGSEVTNFLEKEGINIRYTPIRLVDYLIAGRVAVIRRTVDAFMEDLTNKMVYRTAPEFKRTFPDPLYIVEGPQPAGTISATTHGRSGVTYLTFVHKIPIIFANTPEETAKYLALMMKQAAFASPAEEMPMDSEESQNGSKAEGEPDVQVQILMAVPGITSENAKALLNKFGSMRGVFNAKEPDLSKVKGIGAKKAKAIVSVLDAVDGAQSQRLETPAKARVGR